MPVKDNDGDTLFAASEPDGSAPPWTAEGSSTESLTVALSPLVGAFHAHGKISLLADLFETLYLHWPSVEGGAYQSRSPAAPRYAKLSGASRFEPTLIEGFEQAKLLLAGHKLLGEISSFRSTRGATARALLATLARKMLTVDPTLRARDGRREVLVNGARVSPLSPFDLLRGAIAALQDDVDASPSTRADWDAIVDALHDTYLGTEMTGPEAARFQNTRAAPTAARVLAFLRTRAERHAANRNLSAWLTTDLTKQVEDLITSPELPPLFDLLHIIDADAELSSALAEIRDELLDEARGLEDLTVTAVDLVSAAKDLRYGVHLLRFVGRELDPNNKLLFAGASVADRALSLDSDEHLLEVLRRALDAPEDGGLYAYGLSRAIRQANRVDPLENSSPSRLDITQIVGVVARYLKDEEHGVEKFYDMVEKRTQEGRAP